MDKFYHVLKLANRTYFVRNEKSSELTRKLAQVVMLTMDANSHYFMFTTNDATVSMWEFMTVEFIVEVMRLEPVVMELRGNWILRSNEKAIIDERTRKKRDA